MFRFVFLAIITAACSFGPSSTTVTGEIDDAEIRLDASTGPAEVWLELEHVGTQPCQLVPLLATDSANLPVADDRVVMSPGDPTAGAEPIEAFVELNGEPVDRDGTLTDAGWVTEVRPGDTVRLQIAFNGVPDAGERVVLCNEPGGYALGRLAVLPFER